MEDLKILRDQLASLLNGREAHVDVLSAVGDLARDAQGKRPQGEAHSAWELLEHIRLSQADILDYMTNPGYVERRWPEDYWPESPSPPAPDSWDESVRAIRADLRKITAIVKDPKTDLFAQIPHGAEGHTILREVLIVADHNAYHVGQVVAVRKLLGAWGVRAG